MSPSLSFRQARISFHAGPYDSPDSFKLLAELKK